MDLPRIRPELDPRESTGRRFPERAQPYDDFQHDRVRSRNGVSDDETDDSICGERKMSKFAYSPSAGRAPGSTPRFEQDGPDFYDAHSHEHIASYKHLVKHDYDVKGAQEARLHFKKDHPHYLHEEE